MLNKDDNIHKSEALRYSETVGETDINTCIVSELNNQNFVVLGISISKIRTIG